MNLKSFSQSQLDQRIKTLAQKERDLLHEVLLTIKEIDSRKAFLELGFGSLFEYLVHGVGYSEGSAQRRIDAARLLKEIPGIAEKIQSGEIKLNQISLVQKAAREVFKTQAVKVSAQDKIELLNKLNKKSHFESQKEVASFFDLPILDQAKQKVQSDESVRVEFTLSKEAFEKLKLAQELLSHSVPTQDLATFLEHVCDKVIKQKTSARAPASATDAATGTIKTLPSFSGDKFAVDSSSSSDNTTFQIKAKPAITAINEQVSVAANVALRLPLVRKKEILSTQVCCQYKSPVTGKTCGSKWFAQVDHKQPRLANGQHQVSNLQRLCAQHNQLKYRQETGIAYKS